jgi:hypothetical protein
MRIAYLAQEFDVDATHTVREEFYSVYQQQLQVGRARCQGRGSARACFAGLGGSHHPWLLVLVWWEAPGPC